MKPMEPHCKITSSNERIQTVLSKLFLSKLIFISRFSLKKKTNVCSTLKK